MNRLPFDKRCQMLRLLVEGNSLRGITRIMGVSINTVTKFLEDMGQCAAEYQDQTFRNLNCKRLQVDEVWSFCYARKKNLPEELKGQSGYGDLWTWIAMDPDTKLVPCWMVGDRTLATAKVFLADLAPRLANRVQLSTDGYSAYIDSVTEAFGDNVDHGMLVKVFSDNRKNKDVIEFLGRTAGACAYVHKGAPDLKHVQTNAVERQNLTLRMSSRRFARRTNAHSKKAQNHMHALSIHYLWYNLGRVHQTLKTTPAIKAGVTDKHWTIADMIKLLEEWELEQSLVKAFADNAPRPLVKLGKWKSPHNE